jgi:hypothetical protein
VKPHVQESRDPINFEVVFAHHALWVFYWKDESGLRNHEEVWTLRGFRGDGATTTGELLNKHTGEALFEPVPFRFDH